MELSVSILQPSLSFVFIGSQLSLVSVAWNRSCYEQGLAKKSMCPIQCAMKFVMKNGNIMACNMATILLLHHNCCSITPIFHLTLCLFLLSPLLSSQHIITHLIDTEAWSSSRVPPGGTSSAVCGTNMTALEPLLYQKWLGLILKWRLKMRERYFFSSKVGVTFGLLNSFERRGKSFLITKNIKGAFSIN